MNMTETTMAADAEGEQVSRKKLMEDLKTVVADAEELLKATVGQTGERISAARVKAEESLKAAKARLAVHEKALLAKSKEVMGAAEDYVRTNPWKGVGIAALAGLIIGILAARR